MVQAQTLRLREWMGLLSTSTPTPALSASGSADSTPLIGTPLTFTFPASVLHDRLVWSCVSNIPAPQARKRALT